MTDLERNYRVKERAEDLVKKHGTANNAILYLEQELEEMEFYWSKYSSDCLGHGILCRQLLISWLKEI